VIAIDRPPSCIDDTLCGQLYDWTGNVWIAETGNWLVLRLLPAILIFVAAAVVRRMLHRTIDRLTRTTVAAQRPRVLRLLRERSPNGDSALALLPERRRQRAEAIGSALRSFSSVIIYANAALLAVIRLGYSPANLLPLVTSAGIIGVALAFGAQTLVRDLIAGLCMLLEDQYGIGDTVDLGAATGVVEAVGWRITTVRDPQGVVWHIRNGEIIRVGNKSQGWAMAVVDLPIGFGPIEAASLALSGAAAEFAKDPEFAADLIEPPTVVGVEAVTVDGAVLRTTVKTTVDAQPRVSRELRRRLIDTLETAGLMAHHRPGQRTKAPTQPDPETGQGGAT